MGQGDGPMDRDAATGRQMDAKAEAIEVMGRDDGKDAGPSLKIRPEEGRFLREHGRTVRACFGRSGGT